MPTPMNFKPSFRTFGPAGAPRSTAGLTPRVKTPPVGGTPRHVEHGSAGAPTFANLIGSGIAQAGSALVNGANNMVKPGGGGTANRPTVTPKPGRPTSGTPRPGNMGGGYMNVPNPVAGVMALGQQGINQSYGDMRAAALDSVLQAGQSIVGGPLSGVSSPSGNMQSPGLYTAQANASTHAQPWLDPTRGGHIAVNDYVTDPTTGQRRLGNQGNYGEVTEMLGGRAPAAGYGPAPPAAGTSPAGGAGGAGAAGTNPVTGSGNPAMALFEQLMADAQEKDATAKANTEARYQEALGMRRDQQARAQGDIRRVGQQATQDINRRAKNASGAVNQSLTSRGLANTTSAPILERGVQREAGAERRRLGDDLSRMRLDADNMLTGNIAGILERRNDIGPDFGQMLDLALKYGQSGAGMTPQTPQTPQLGSLDGLLPLLQQIAGAGMGPLPNMGYPNLQFPNLPQLPQMIQAQQQQQQAQQQQRPISQTLGRPPQGGSLGGTLGALGAYGAQQFIPQAASGIMDFFQGQAQPDQWGNYLGNAIAGGAGAASGALQQGVQGLGQGLNQLYSMVDPRRFLPMIPNFAG